VCWYVGCDDCGGGVVRKKGQRRTLCSTHIHIVSAYISGEEGALSATHSGQTDVTRHYAYTAPRRAAVNHRVKPLGVKPLSRFGFGGGEEIGRLLCSHKASVGGGC
jgi:hypothetical protein